jgi:hypothetical protein
VTGRLALALALAVAALAPASAAARPCSDNHPVVVRGVHWIVYTGDSAREKRDLPCRKARRIARRYIADRVEPSGWNCRHTRAVKRCVHRAPRYLVGWHRAD